MTRKMADSGRGPAAEPTAPAVAPVVAPAVSATPAPDPMAALNSLADLRDRGAISPEEYEAKKTELLARM